MRQLLAFMFILNLTPPSFGQGRDTAFAVHNLFKERRNRGWMISGYGLAGLTGMVFTTAQGKAAPAIALGLFTVVSTGLGLRQYTRYSAEREAAAVQAYENGWGLPPNIRRRLRSKHFRAAR